MEPDAPRSEANRGSASEPLAETAASVQSEPLAESAEPAEFVAEAPLEIPEGSVPVEPVLPASVAAAVAGEPPARSGGPVRLLGYLLAGILGVALTVAVLAGTGSIGAASPSAPPTPAATPAPTFALDGSAMGVASAPVTIEIWADYQCPYCGLLTHGIEPALIREEAATGKARIAFRDFAFLGQESTDAAVAARCAEREGLFWRYHDLLFASQNGENRGAFSRERLLGLASFAGVADIKAFTACLGDPAVAKGVVAETVEGRSYGIESTPTIRITGPGPTQFLKGVADPAKIAAAVLKASTPAPSSSPGSDSSPGPGSSPGRGSSPGPGSSPAVSPVPSPPPTS